MPGVGSRTCKFNSAVLSACATQAHSWHDRDAVRRGWQPTALPRRPDAGYRSQVALSPDDSPERLDRSDAHAGTKKPQTPFESSPAAKTTGGSLPVISYTSSW